jgi:predicted flavoprotein YhiN
LKLTAAPPRPPGSTSSGEADSPPPKRRKGKAEGKAAVLAEASGAMLLTHVGVSGPSALRLSAFGARHLSLSGYHGSLSCNWCGDGWTREDVVRRLEESKASRAWGGKAVATACPLRYDPGRAGAATEGSKGLAEGSLAEGSTKGSPEGSAVVPQRLWAALVSKAGLAPGTKWASVPTRQLRQLAATLTACDLSIVGKGAFKEEFVTCGEHFFHRAADHPIVQ